MKEQDPRQVIATLLGVGGLVVAVIAFAQFYSANRTSALAAHIKPQPQRLTADELGRSGPGDNLYVHLTNLEFGEDTLTIRSSRNKRWQRVYLPAYPRGASRKGPLGAPLIMVSSGEVGDRKELLAFQQRTSVVGVVTNPLEGVPEQVEKFKEKYPNFRGQDIWVVDVSRPVPTPAKARSTYFTACLLVCTAIGCLVGCGWMNWNRSTAARPDRPSVKKTEDDLGPVASEFPTPPALAEENTTASQLAARFNPRRR